MASATDIIKKDLESIRPTFEQLNLNGLSFFKELEYATQIFANNTYLAGALPESKRNALVNVALAGLSLSPVLKYAYLVPRKMKNNLMCVVEPSYMGLCKILTDTGSVVALSATIVYEKETGVYKDEHGNTVDRFQIKTGVAGWVKHTPYIGFDKPGKPIACYSIGVLPSGLQHVELLRPWEWENIKQRSESVKSYNRNKEKGEYAAEPTWNTDPEEMIRKTCLKKHYKYLPKTEQAEQIGNVIDLDNQANGIDFEKQQRPAEDKTATPNAPVDLALATDEDLSILLEWFDNPELPEIIFGKIKKSAMRAKIEQKYALGQLEKDKAEEYIAGLKQEVEKAIAAKQEGGKP
jgi:recombination protein RecT